MILLEQVEDHSLQLLVITAQVEGNILLKLFMVLENNPLLLKETMIGLAEDLNHLNQLEDQLPREQGILPQVENHLLLYQEEDHHHQDQAATMQQAEDYPLLVQVILAQVDDLHLQCQAAIQQVEDHLLQGLSIMKGR